MLNQDLEVGSIVLSADGHKYVAGQIVPAYKLRRFVRLCDSAVMFAPLSMMFTVVEG